MELAQRTDTGRVRDHNEDSLECFRAQCGTLVVVVADGMGGHQAGEIASSKTLEVIKNDLSKQYLDLSTDEKSNRLLISVGKANDNVYKLAKSNQQYNGMGTTVLASIVDENEVVIAHVGDSRAYMLHKGGLYQLTEDHTYVNILYRHGQITKEEAENHPQRNVIVRAIGTAEEVEVDLINTPWKENDIFLLCSDGLTDMVSERQIGLVLTDNSLTLDGKADRLVELALQAGGKDNISVILIKNTGKATRS